MFAVVVGHRSVPVGGMIVLLDVGVHLGWSREGGWVVSGKQARRGFGPFRGVPWPFEAVSTQQVIQQFRRSWHLLTMSTGGCAMRKLSQWNGAIYQKFQHLSILVNVILSWFFVLARLGITKLSSKFEQNSWLKLDQYLFLTQKPLTGKLSHVSFWCSLMSHVTNNNKIKRFLDDLFNECRLISEALSPSRRVHSL